MDFDVRALVPDVPLFGSDQERRDLIAHILQDAAHAALTATAGAIAAIVPSDTGGTAAAFRVDPATSIGGIELTGHADASDAITGRIFTDAPGAIVLEEGRAPGAFVNRDGIANLTAWAERKLGVSGKDAERAAFAIATLLQRRGLPARPFMAQAEAMAGPEIDRIFADAGAAIAAALTGGS